MVNSNSQKYSNKEVIQRAFYRVAWNVHHLWEETGHSDTRLFMEPIIRDRFVIVGKSRNGSTHKEHIVPRVIICTQCHLMFENGESINSVAKFIRKYLKIVLISKHEQKHLDKKVNLNLRQKMPEGWTFENGCEFDRLKVAGIKYDLCSNT